MNTYLVLQRGIAVDEVIGNVKLTFLDFKKIQPFSV
jgi:hypothetical protein